MAALPLHSSRSSKGWQEGRLIVGICATLLFAAILMGYAFEWNQILYKSGNEKSIAIEDLSFRIGGAEDFGILGVPWCRSRKGLTVDWTRDDLIQGMKLFVSVYHTRPIKHNIGGMRFDHSFGLWFLARRLQPQLVIESGAFKGHSTWVIRQALPNIPIISITPRHPQKYLKKGPAYVDMNCKYFSGKDFIDFGNIQWESILEEYNIVDKSKVLLFFDDHQSELKRLKQALRSGFQNLIFEDNYDTGTGDHYSMRQICDQGFIKGGGHSCEEGSNEIRLRASRKGQWDMAVDAKQLCGHDGAWWGVRGQMVDNFNHNMTKISAREHYENGKMVESVLDLYWELPPVASLKLTKEIVDSVKTSLSRVSSSSSTVSDSNESICSSFSSGHKPHKGKDRRWESVLAAQMKDGALGLSHFRLLKRLGCGDIGSVYLCELRATDSYFAMKVMDKCALASRKKLLRVQTEREILQMLDHPFLPTLYAHFETDKFSCLVMEFCPGGDLHVLRQRQAGKYFPEHVARFYAAEVLLALEYLHMMGIVYRDLKPENVLVREDGHVMLSDFDLSLRCVVNPMLVKSSFSEMDPSKRTMVYCAQPACLEPTCIPPPCVAPACFVSKLLPSKPKKVQKPKNVVDNRVPELIAEPTGTQSMSFVGTHEYLAPEIIKGEGHGSAVDWWTFGIFLYELLHGRTPFKGDANRATLLNVIGQPLRFPQAPSVSYGARDLIRGLLVKDPQHRLAYKRGATEIKQHPFFEGINWALIRSMRPPEIPRRFDLELARSQSAHQHGSVGKNQDDGSSMPYLDFEFF